ncbi:MAG: asparagine synthase (glutamine-hydrolyzing) [Alphaproteobacteria bacterium]|nr:asparagine synthase (glutamine-hydrolyzing) [Alphaproteobacteria bacterium]
MCGIAGLFDYRARRVPDALAAQGRAMSDALLHRGPDAGGVWSDAAAGVALGHRRLSIIDLTEAGAQPMVSSCGRFVVSYNGEAYNADALKPELEAAGRKFRGHCDTEVIVEGCAVWGVEVTIKRLIGMFALALWDRQERALYLVRDRLGIKPMYWVETGETLLFGSELKALRAVKEWQPALDRDAVAAYLRFAYVPGSRGIYQGVRQLAPGTMLVARAGRPVEIREFWSLDDVAAKGQADRFAGSEDEAVQILDALLGDAVKRRMIADVPLGAFLSGGIDSSTVLALMQKVSNRPVRSFSIGFHEKGFDEAPHAARVAKHLGTDHTELYVQPGHALEIIPRLPTMYDEPFADPSQIPIFLVAEMTRRHVTVALSGDGGDELFAGYTRYFRSEAVRKVLDTVPRGARRAAAAAVKSVAPGTWSALGSWAMPQFGDRVHKLAGALAGTPADFYRLMVTHWDNPDAIVRGGAEPRGLLWDESLAQRVPDPVERMQYLDTLTYLPDDILTKVDRASMAVALEARVPLLDHRVVEFSWRLKPVLKASGGVGKRILRRVLDRYVPKALIDRPKMGFGVPIDSWLRGPLKDWAETLLGEKRLAAEGVFDPAPIRAKWREHLSGERNWQYPLWTVLMFQAWKERWLP